MENSQFISMVKEARKRKMKAQTRTDFESNIYDLMCCCYAGGLGKYGDALNELYNACEELDGCSSELIDFFNK